MSVATLREKLLYYVLPPTLTLLLTTSGYVLIAANSQSLGSVQQGVIPRVSVTEKIPMDELIFPEVQSSITAAENFSDTPDGAADPAEPSINNSATASYCSLGDSSGRCNPDSNLYSGNSVSNSVKVKRN